MKSTSFLAPAANVFYLLVIRHGQVLPHEYVDGDTRYPKGDPPLTDLGMTQAEYLAEEFARLNFDGILYSSPFLRALQTAQPVAKKLGLKIRPEVRLHEIIRTKATIETFTGHSMEQLRELVPEIETEATLPEHWWPYEPETAVEVRARVTDFLGEVFAAGKNAALFSHGAAVNALTTQLMKLSGMDFDDYFRQPPRSNCSLSIFRVEKLTQGNFSGAAQLTQGNFSVTPVRVLGTDHLPSVLISSNPNYALNRKKHWIRACSLPRVTFQAARSLPRVNLPGVNCEAVTVDDAADAMRWDELGLKGDFRIAVGGEKLATYLKVAGDTDGDTKADTEADKAEAISKGRIALADPERWEGTLDFSMGIGTLVGEVFPHRANQALTVRAIGHRLPENGTLHVLIGGREALSINLPGVDLELAVPVSAGDRENALLRLEIHDSEGKTVYYSNPIFLTLLK